MAVLALPVHGIRPSAAEKVEARSSRMSLMMKGPPDWRRSVVASRRRHRGSLRPGRPGPGTGEPLAMGRPSGPRREQGGGECGRHGFAVDRYDVVARRKREAVRRSARPRARDAARTRDPIRARPSSTPPAPATTGATPAPRAAGRPMTRTASRPSVRAVESRDAIPPATTRPRPAAARPAGGGDATRPPGRDRGQERGRPHQSELGRDPPAIRRGRIRGGVASIPPPRIPRATAAPSRRDRGARARGPRSRSPPSRDPRPPAAPRPRASRFEDAPRPRGPAPGRRAPGSARAD